MQVLAATLPATVKVAQQNLKDTKVSFESKPVPPYTTHPMP